ncbi:MAG: alanine racemase [Spirochaetes bacterium]|nr:alanine racemase [Spirochaetota bacterium]
MSAVSFSNPACRTRAQIHLGNIRANIDSIRAAIGRNRRILLPVKADAYGHGAIEVSRMAERIGVEWLGVATVPEGRKLRDAGIALPVLKMSPTFPGEMEEAIRAGLTLTVCDRENAAALERSAAAAGIVVRVHLKVDTGMGRIGVAPEEAPPLAAFLERSCANLRLDGVFTHLPVSDDADPTWTRGQVARFVAVVEEIDAAIGRRVGLVHCSNSGAVLGHEEAWMDLVRPGIMAYGCYPDAGTPRTINLKPGLSFLTRISFLKRVAAGTSVSYGRTWTAMRDTWIATLAVGYADGFNRLFSNRGRVLVGGRSFPVAGRVCMDQTMIDLGTETDASVGDEVVLIGSSGGEKITCDDWARELGTIPYEVTCQINARVERMFDPY